MEMILTSATVSAEKLEQWGFLSQVLPAHEVIEAAKKCACTIAGQSSPVVQLAKQSILNGQH